MTSESAISVEKLCKMYGEHAAIHNLSFRIEPGEIVGFLGPNGAGKSTTLRILSGFIGATSGRASIAGFDVATQALQARKSIGYMPEAVPLYREMRVREYLSFRAELKAIKRKERAREVQQAMDDAHVADVADTRIDDLSKGYRQRVGLADAFLGSPPVLILDEPTAGMDPNQILEVRSQVRKRSGKQTILLSTHILSEVEACCSRILLINKGTLIAQGTAEELASMRKAPHLKLILRGNEALIQNALKPISLIRYETQVIEDSVVRVHVQVLADDDNETPKEEELNQKAEEIASKLVESKVFLRSLSREKTSLEDIFTELTTK